MSDHGHHDNPFIEHHFEGPQHQFDSGKLGIWIFLVTEVLFFSGLFVAYIIYRAHHFEIFEYANHYLDTKLGVINTVVLLFSSLTAAWAVRCAQLNQRRGLIACLAITLVCACGFLTIKGLEYKAKADYGTLWGQKFDPKVAADGTPLEEDDAPEGDGELDEGGASDEGETPDESEAAEEGGATEGGEAPDESEASEERGAPEEGEPDESAPAEGGAEGADEAEEAATADTDFGEFASSRAVPTEDVPAELGEATASEAAAEGPAEGGAEDGGDGGEDEFLSGPPPPNTSMFFSIYFGMTGLHAIHVTIGVGIFIWLLVRAIRGHFSSEYFGPVDYSALYWHLVDLIWIYLFPLLYLIH